MLTSAMRRVLQDRFSPAQLKQAVRDVWRNYADLAQNLPAAQQSE
jgi:hypothetical protein